MTDTPESDKSPDPEDDVHITLKRKVVDTLWQLKGRNKSYSEMVEELIEFWYNKKGTRAAEMLAQGVSFTRGRREDKKG